MLQGRVIGAAQLLQVRQLLERHPDWSRYRLSVELCQLWDWRAPNRQLKDMAARTLLLKLEQRGLVRLPPKRRASPKRMLHKRVRPVAHAREPIRDALARLTPLEVIELSQRPQEQPLYEWLLHEHHYLGYSSPVGLNLKYLVWDYQGRPLGCLLFGSAAWKCAPRDQFIGWTPAVRGAHLPQPPTTAPVGPRGPGQAHRPDPASGSNAGPSASGGARVAAASQRTQSAAGPQQLQ
jgi:hypothetical protein